MPCMCCVYTIHVLTKVFWYSDYNIVICHVCVVFIQYMYWLKYFDIPTKILWYAMYMLHIYYTCTENLCCQGPQSGPGLSSDWNIHGIYMVYTWYIPRISLLWVKPIFCVHSNCCPVLPCSVHVFPILPTSIASL